MLGHLKSSVLCFLIFTVSWSANAQSTALSDFVNRIEESIASLKDSTLTNAQREEKIKSQYHSFGNEYESVRDIAPLSLEDEALKVKAFSHFNRVTVLSKLTLGKNGKGTAESCAYTSSLLAVMELSGADEMAEADLSASDSEIDKNVKSVITLFCN
jgi:hypothetical protein